MPNAFKRTAAYIGYRLKLWNLGYALFRIWDGKPMLVVFTFHRVTDSERSREYYMYYERGIDYRIFELQLDAIAAYFAFVDLDQFVDIIKGRNKSKRHTALLTFDDADSEFVEYAQPLLHRRRIPSVMFAPTDFIESANRFWHLRVSNVVRKLEPGHWEKMRCQTETLPTQIKDIIMRDFPSDEAKKRRLALDLNHAFDLENIKDVMRTIENWETIVGGDFLLGIKCLTWEQLRNLSMDGVHIESHSASHGKLAQCHGRELREELENSKKILEREVGRTVKAISYPGGSYNEAVMEAAREAGYMVGFTTENGFCRYPLDDPDVYRLPRYSLYGDTTAEIHYALGALAVNGILGRRV